jgi:uncharacterized protein YdiU (UPF0061 family)
MTELTWETRFVSRFPGDPEAANFTRPVKNALYSEVSPTPVRNPVILGWSGPLASELGLARPRQTDPQDQATIELLSGNRVLAGMRPYAARYGGHQFGHWAGQLGDGRAITLGEVLSPGLGCFEYQLKGAGPTPYSRRADGRAVLRSSIREFLCSEAMHSLGVPTTRALSLVSTGDAVVRDMFYDGNPKEEPGAIVCRVSPSFLRFGNFEILAASGESELLKSLADFVIREHHPELDSGDPDVYGKWLDEISRRTAIMVAHWLRVGFVHGVMNTDNMSILGLTIDYGPYGWLEPYDPSWTPNTTDAQSRRYRFAHQPGVAQWNLARLCQALVPLIPDEARLQQSLALFKETFESAYARMLAQKLGLRSIETAEDQRLVEELFGLLAESQADYVLFFRALSGFGASPGASPSFLRLLSPALYASESLTSDTRERWGRWASSYAERILADGQEQSARRLSMNQANPKYVLRNYLAQNAINAASAGDLSVLERLQRVLETPYDELPADEDLAAKRPAWAENAPGCSALSCSS